MKVEIKCLVILIVITGVFFTLAFFVFTDPFSGIGGFGEAEFLFLFFFIISPIFLFIIGLFVGRINTYLIWAFPVYTGVLTFCINYSTLIEFGMIPSVISALSSSIGIVIGYWAGKKRADK